MIEESDLENLPIRVIAEIFGRKVKLCSAYIHRSSGDLIFDPKPGSHWRTNPKSWNTGEKINNIKIQVHISPKSPDGNTISFIANLNQSKEWRHRQFTKAIKTNNKFTPIYARIFPDLRHESHEIDGGDGKSYRIAKFDPRNVSLICVFYVGRAGLRHETLIGNVYNSLHINAGLFEICIMSTYVNLPSIPHGNILFYRTSKDGKEEDYKEVIDGYIGRDMDKNTISMAGRLVDIYIDQCIESLDKSKFPYLRDVFEEIRNSSLRYSRAPHFERPQESMHARIAEYIIDLFRSED